MAQAQLVLIAASMPEFDLVKMLERALIDCKRNRKLDELALPCMLILQKCAVNEKGLEYVLQALKKGEDLEQIRSRMNEN